ncbi:MAG: PAS domain-containing protein, partial [Desulfomonilia bacterium]|nr:PAS domain-containing protein [Desulfomonilia bacterium]
MADTPSCGELQERVEELEEELGRQDVWFKDQERYRIHFSLANDVMYSLDHDFRLMSISPNVHRILGYHPEELLGKPFHELNILAPEYYEQAVENIAQVLSGRKIDSVIYEFFTREGARRFAEVSGVPLMRSGKAIAVISVARDITERIEMERMLVESEQRFRAVFESARDAMFIKNNALEYVLVNPNCETFLGLPAEQILGKRDKDFFDDETFHQVIRMDAKVSQGAFVEEEHTRYLRGEEKTFHLIKVPMKNSSGKVIGICGIARDITERKRVEEELKSKEKE